MDFYKVRPEMRKQTFTQENCKHRGVTWGWGGEAREWCKLYIWNEQHNNTYSVVLIVFHQLIGVGPTSSPPTLRNCEILPSLTQIFAECFLCLNFTVSVQ